ncbi:MAG: AAA family ATPase, partial [Anaerolineales bacterium]
MIPIKLKIQGFLSYQEAVTLDFTGIRLACISGQNGAGKSALLDAITWALFGQARKRDESLINNNPKIEAAEVTLDFNYEGNRYRVQRTNPRGKTSSVEFFILQRIPDEGERWKPLTERTLRETDRKIEHTLRMDYDTFTNAAFFLQGKADQFATARAGERKRILSNILGLEIWESYREEAAARRRKKEKEVRELDGRLSEIQNELDEGPDRKKQLEELQKRLAVQTAQRLTLAKNLENVQRLHASLQEQRKFVATYRTQLENAQRAYQRILDTLTERKAEKSKHEATLQEAEVIERAYESWKKAREDLGAMEEVAETYRHYEALRQEPLRIIHAEEARLNQEKSGLKEKKQELDKLIDQSELLKEQLENAQQVSQLAKDKLTRRGQLEEEIRQLQKKQAEAKAENPRLKAEMDNLRARLDQLEADDKPECPVCGKPLSEEDRAVLIREYYQEGETRRDRYLANKELLDNFESDLNKLGAEFADLRSAENDLREANRIVDQINAQ